MVLLLHTGNHVQYGVHVIGGSGHGKAGGGSGAAVDKEVVRRKSDVHSGEHEGYGGRYDGDCVAGVKSAQG